MYYSSSIHFSAATALWETSSDSKHFANSSIGLKNMYNALNSPRHCGVCSFILAVKFLNTGRISTALVNSVCSSPSPVDGSFIAGITVRVNEPLTFLPQKTYFETKYYHYDWLFIRGYPQTFPLSLFLPQILLERKSLSGNMSFRYNCNDIPHQQKYIAVKKIDEVGWKQHI